MELMFKEHFEIKKIKFYHNYFRARIWNVQQFFLNMMSHSENVVTSFLPELSIFLSKLNLNNYYK